MFLVHDCFTPLLDEQACHILSVSGNKTIKETSSNATAVDEKESVDKTAATTSPNATSVGKNETTNGTEELPTVDTNKTDTGADKSNSNNSDERGNLRGTN